MSNRLKDEKSPYLLQHKDNPVDWYPWCEDAFEKALSEDKPIFLSIGYSTCHWCHVMAHESFEDEKIAELLNNFVCIKVDREERPDVDAVYMSVCQALNGSGGWPLTILMTPAKKPFFAGTYFPKTGRMGRPGLTQILRRTIHIWNTEKEKLLDSSEEITAALLREEHFVQKGAPDKKSLNKAYFQLKSMFDNKWGGFGAAPKFPVPHNLLFLMRYARLENEPEGLLMAEMTLQFMAQGGIFDHIGGGFSRYSTDERWLAPHFEKMLYDNALLILAYLEAYQQTDNMFYADIARKTADYILRELTDEKGGFYCGQDADSEGIEGKYYVFTPKEILSVLGPDKGEEFCRLYDITDHGNFEGSNIPNRIGRSDVMQADAAQLEKLYQYRKTRTYLHTDDKILLSWNAWAIIALVRTGLILRDDRYTMAALEAQRFIQEKMTDMQNRLFLRYREGEAAHTGQLDDYAVYALALLELYGVTFNADFLKQAVFRAHQLLEFFEDKQNGGFFINAHDAEQLITRPKELYDGAIPSGNSVAAMVMERIAGLTGETEWREAADRQLRFISGHIGEYPAGHCFALLAMADFIYPHRELLCAGDHISDNLMAYLRKQPAQALSILFKSKENQSLLSELAPFTLSYPLPEQGVIWYLCENGACRTPVTEFSELNL